MSRDSKTNSNLKRSAVMSPHVKMDSGFGIPASAVKHILEYDYDEVFIIHLQLVRSRGSYARGSASD